MKKLKLNVLFDTISDFAHDHQKSVPDVFMSNVDGSFESAGDASVTLRHRDIIPMPKATKSLTAESKTMNFSWLRKHLPELEMLKLRMINDISAQQIRSTSPSN